MALDCVLTGLLDDALLAGEGRREMQARLMPTLDKAKLHNLLGAVGRVYAATTLIDYCYDSIAFTRRSPHFPRGLSPRAGLALLRAARAWALLVGRDVVYPEDDQAVLGPCVGYRLDIVTEEVMMASADDPAVPLILDQVPLR
jgi:MoxR-like ATPase